MEYIIDKYNYKKYNIGTKAINLFKMAEQGINIPNFFCINNEWLEKKLKDKKHSINKLIKEIDYSDEEKVELISNKINDLIEKTFEDSEFKEFVNQYINTNFKKEDIFAVRSSSLLEDSEAVSFAGQFNSFLDIKKEEIFSYILKCYKSLYAPNVLSYCNYQNISTSKLKMNVIVQLMINPEAAGVIFSANPQGILNEAVVVVGKGVGKNIVEDKVSTTSYYYNLADDLYYYETQENSPTLQEDILKELIELSKKISDLFKKYMDIEYAISEEIVYILQARPITTIKDTGENIILDNSNIVESYPGITLPLTKSFIRIAYYEIFKSCFNRLSNNSNNIKKFDSILENMVDSANGRIFYRISNW
jgi:pyruvate,water dikinase